MYVYLTVKVYMIVW